MNILLTWRADDDPATTVLVRDITQPEIDVLVEASTVGGDEPVTVNNAWSTSSEFPRAHTLRIPGSRITGVEVVAS